MASWNERFAAWYSRSRCAIFFCSWLRRTGSRQRFISPQSESLLSVRRPLTPNSALSISPTNECLASLNLACAHKPTPVLPSFSPSVLPTDFNPLTAFMGAFFTALAPPITPLRAVSSARPQRCAVTTPLTDFLNLSSFNNSSFFAAKRPWYCSSLSPSFFLPTKRWASRSAALFWASMRLRSPLVNLSKAAWSPLRAASMRSWLSLAPPNFFKRRSPHQPNLPSSRSVFNLSSSSWFLACLCAFMRSTPSRTRAAPLAAALPAFLKSLNDCPIVFFASPTISVKLLDWILAAPKIDVIESRIFGNMDTNATKANQLTNELVILPSTAAPACFSTTGISVTKIFNEIMTANALIASL